MPREQQEQKEERVSILPKLVQERFHRGNENFTNCGKISRWYARRGEGIREVREGQSTSCQKTMRTKATWFVLTGLRSQGDHSYSNFNNFTLSPYCGCIDFLP